MLKTVSLIIAGIAAIAAAAWLISDRLGWSEVDRGAPPQVSIAHDPSFEQAAQTASNLLLETYKSIDAVGMTAAVSIDGERVWTGAIGWADVKTNAEASPDTVFRIGSTSKAVTATLAARMVDAGTVELETPISAYKSDLPEHWRALTLRQLESHTAGLPDYESNSDLGGLLQTLAMNREYANVDDSLEIFDGSRLLYDPGTDFLYTSFDINLVSAVLQAADGSPFPDLLKREVLDPLAMTSTAPSGLHPQPDRIATFYQLREGRAKPWRKVDLSQRWAGGGLLSTSADLTRVCDGWFDPDFLSPETRKTFWTPQRLASGEVNEQGYALGWRARPDYDGLGDGVLTDRYHHGGVSKGAMSWLVCYPQYRLAIAMNINTRAAEFSHFNANEPAITRAFITAIRDASTGSSQTEGNEIYIDNR